MKDFGEETRVERRVALCCREAGLRAALTTVLRSEGCAVADCGSDAVAVDDLAENAPDLIVIEAQSREAAGFELCQTLRAASGLADAKLLVLLDSGRSIARRRAEALGANAVLSLPMRMAAFQAEVDRLLDRV